MRYFVQTNDFVQHPAMRLDIGHTLFSAIDTSGGSRLRRARSVGKLMLKLLIWIHFGAALRRSVRWDIIVLTVCGWWWSVVVQRDSLSMAVWGSMVEDTASRKELWVTLSLCSGNKKLRLVSYGQVVRRTDILCDISKVASLSSIFFAHGSNR